MAAAAAGAERAEAAPGVRGAAGGLLPAAAAAARPRTMDRDTWGLHPGPPPPSHGSAQKCPSRGRAGFPAAQAPTPKPPSLRRRPQRKPGTQAPVFFPWLRSSGAAWGPDAATQGCIARGRRGLEREAAEKELRLRRWPWGARRASSASLLAGSTALLPSCGRRGSEAKPTSWPRRSLARPAPPRPPPGSAPARAPPRRRGLPPAAPSPGRAARAGSCSFRRRPRPGRPFFLRQVRPEPAGRGDRDVRARGALGGGAGPRDGGSGAP